MRYDSPAEMPSGLRALYEAQCGGVAVKRETATVPRSNDKAAMFLAYWRMYLGRRLSGHVVLDLPEPVAEYRFAPPRRWRMDFAWPALHIGVEIDGGRFAFGGGRHGTDADRDKLNRAASLSWRVFRFAPSQLAREAPACIAMVATAVREALEGQ